MYSLSAFEQKKEGATYEANQLNGFWSPDKYYGFLNTFKYDAEKVSLDKYIIVEPNRTRRVYKWLQYISPEDLKSAFTKAGFYIKELFADDAGTPYGQTPSEFVIIADRG